MKIKDRRTRFVPLWFLLTMLGALSAACAPRTAPPAAEPDRPAVRPPEPRRPLVSLRIGVLLPQGGALRQYSDAVLEGVRVAAAEIERDSTYHVEILVRDAASPAAAAAAARELAAAGVAAIIGPLLDEDVSAVAAARADSTLPIISPTATSSYGGLRQVYPLNVPDTLGAHELGRYAARQGYARVAVLRPRAGPSAAQARAFAGSYRAAAGRAPLEVTYEPGTTTFAAVLGRLRDARTTAFFLAAEERDVRQILPQVQYYGLSEAQVLASGSWTTPDALDRIGLRTLEDVVVTLPFLPDDSSGGWQRFVRAYEGLHRRSLENAVPALGYDAAQLALAGRAAGGLGSAAAAARLRSGERVAGATGELLPRPGIVLRQPILVRVRGGALIPLPAVER